jgi:FAD dependent oxidoreductase
MAVRTQGNQTLNTPFAPFSFFLHREVRLCSGYCANMIVIVVGAGVFGLTSAIELQARGHHVTLFEQSKIAHDNAASSDTSR